MANDEKTLCSVARWFIKDYQFVSDAYRLFSALNRLCNTGNSWFRNSRTQKYILRQIKAMDYSIVPNVRKESLFSERAGYSTKDEDGNWITAKALELALLMLYGHILYVGKSYSFSISTSLRESLSIEDGVGLTFHRLLLTRICPGSKQSHHKSLIGPGLYPLRDQTSS